MASSVKVNKITPTTACGTVTLGDSGDTISIPSGASLNIGGSVSGIEGILNWDTTAKTSGFTAVAGNGYFVNTTSAPITVTLPATPSAGDLVGVKDYALTAQTNNITLARNGSNIQGVANDFLINTQGRSVTLIYVDGTQGWMITGASQASDISEEAFFITATGGTITTSGDYKIHTFTSPGTFTVCSVGNPAGSDTVDYLVVAGGGGASGNRAGGGGAGGFRESSGAASGSYTASPLGACVSALPVTATGYPITVGGGGSPGTPSGQTAGSNSVFSTITSAGGGESNGQPGGSGSGGIVGSAGGTGNTPPVSPPQGNPGGNGGPNGGGGGGGAGAAGTVGNPSPTGAGGAGVTTSISASPTAYAGGGGGGEDLGKSVPGGLGGGGASGNAGTPGSTNTGGGGGGGNYPGTGGAGGSGIVIIRYKYQ